MSTSTRRRPTARLFDAAPFRRRRLPFRPVASWVACGLQLIVAGAVAFASAGCAAKASGPPEIVVDRTSCSHCGMLVSERAYAAAYQIDGAEPRIFDDIGCLLEDMRRHAGRETEGAVRTWFHDAVDSGWIEGRPAAFLSGSAIRTPMGGGVVAYRDEAAAARAAAQHGGEVVRSFSQLSARQGGVK